jgi:hypothetical protein
MGPGEYVRRLPPTWQFPVLDNIRTCSPLGHPGPSRAIARHGANDMGSVMTRESSCRGSTCASGKAERFIVEAASPPEGHPVLPGGLAAWLPPGSIARRHPRDRSAFPRPAAARHQPVSETPAPSGRIRTMAVPLLDLKAQFRPIEAGILPWTGCCPPSSSSWRRGAALGGISAYLGCQAVESPREPMLCCWPSWPEIGEGTGRSRPHASPLPAPSTGRARPVFVDIDPRHSQGLRRREGVTLAPGHPLVPFGQMADMDPAEAASGASRSRRRWSRPSGRRPRWREETLRRNLGPPLFVLPSKNPRGAGTGPRHADRLADRSARGGTERTSTSTPGWG